MKTVLLPLAVCLSFTCAMTLRAADAKPMPKEVAALLTDYQKEFAKAKEPTDKLLRQEASKIAAKLVADGHAEEAKLIGAQVEDKVAGKPVADVHSQLVTLFGQYDSAVANAAKPIREKYGRRVDALLQSFAGKDMNAVIVVGDAKKVIEGGDATRPPTLASVPPPQLPPVNPATPTPGTPPKTAPPVVPVAKSTSSPAQAIVGQKWTSTFSYEFKANGEGLKTTTSSTSRFTWKVVGPDALEVLTGDTKWSWTFAPADGVWLAKREATDKPTRMRLTK